MVQLLALKPFTYNRQAVRVGETFTATDTHATLLVLAKKAVRTDASATPPRKDTPVPERRRPPVEDEPPPFDPDEDVPEPEPEPEQPVEDPEFVTKRALPQTRRPPLRRKPSVGR